MELPERCPLCGAMPVNDLTIPKALYRLYGDCYCNEIEESKGEAGNDEGDSD
jgi:hypothetical protein